MDATVVVATFGHGYEELARRRAIPSAEAQCDRVIYSHSDTLAAARNKGAAEADTEWLVFLDADDELAPGYLDALNRADGDLRAPAVSYVYNGTPDPPIVFADRDITVINPCVIGTAVRAEMFHEVSGFLDEPVYEDWSLFLRCHRAGAELVHVPDAVYLAHVNPRGRNSQNAGLRRRTYRRIKEQFG